MPFMLTALLLLAPTVFTETYHVRTDGDDAAARSGLSNDEAFATLAYACERAPEGATIRLHGGEHRCTRAAKPKSGQQIRGNGFHGDYRGWSRLVHAADAWEQPQQDADGQFFHRIGDVQLGEASLIFARKISGLEISGVKFESPESKGDEPVVRGLCAVYLDDCTDTRFDTCRFQRFRWCGIGAFVCEDLEVHLCGFESCSTDRIRHRGGQIYTRWMTDVDITRCRFIPAENSGGYGYKGGGHTGCRITDCTFERCYFAIEIPHENEAGIEIAHNTLHGAISVPKGGDAAPPQKRGFPFAVEIHHNRMTDSYGIEGPRNYLYVHHNYIKMEKPNGRFYAQFGGHTDGPIWIERNVFENVDRAIVWQREGTTRNLFFRNNTVVMADAGPRNEVLFGAWAGDRIDNWVIADNVFVSPYSRSRKLLRTERGVPEKIAFSGNLLVNFDEQPPGTQHLDPQLTRAGEKPWAFYAPVEADGPTVDTATLPRLDAAGKAADIGAVEHGVSFEAVGERPW